MYQANIHDAKTHLSELIKRALAGEKIIIARNGEPVVELKPVQAEPLKPRELGRLRGKIKFYPGWDEPLTEEFEEFFNNKIFPDGDV